MVHFLDISLFKLRPISITTPLGPIRDPGYDPVRVGWVRLEKSQIKVTGFGQLVTNHVVR